jgi:serine protease Do
MRTFAFSMAALAICLSAPAAYAQQKDKSNTKKEETIIIKKKGGDGPQTVVEIKDGDVYVNGEKVAGIGDKATRKKIIIDSDGDVADAPAFNFNGRSLGDDRPMLGVMTNPQKSTNGAFIEEVTSGSAASDAGLKKGDVITKIDKEPIASPKDLVDAIAKHEVGEKVTVTYERDGKTSTTDATLSGMMPQGLSRMYNFRDLDELNIPNPMMPFRFDASDDFSPTPKLGITAEDRADDGGVNVLEVKPNSVAEKAGLRKDDVITKLDDENINSADELQRELRKTKMNEKIKLQYQRAGKTATTDILLPKQTKKKDL